MYEWNVFTLANEEGIVFIEYRAALITIIVESDSREICYFIKRIKGNTCIQFA